MHKVFLFEVYVAIARRRIINPHLSPYFWRNNVNWNNNWVNNKIRMNHQTKRCLQNICQSQRICSKRASVAAVVLGVCVGRAGRARGRNKGLLLLLLLFSSLKISAILQFHHWRNTMFVQKQRCNDQEVQCGLCSDGGLARTEQGGGMVVEAMLWDRCCCCELVKKSKLHGAAVTWSWRQKQLMAMTAAGKPTGCYSSNFWALCGKWLQQPWKQCWCRMSIEKCQETTRSWQNRKGHSHDGKSAKAKKTNDVASKENAEMPSIGGGKIATVVGDPGMTSS